MRRPFPYRRPWVVLQPHSPITEPTYLTDTTCSFCTTTMRGVQGMFPGTFAAVSYWDAPLGDYGLTVEQCDAVGHFLLPISDGGVQVMAGHYSWAGVLLVQRNPAWQLLGRVMTARALHLLLAVVYLSVAKSRRLLGPTNKCALPQPEGGTHAEY